MEEFISKGDLLYYIQDTIDQNRQMMFGSQYNTDILEGQNLALKNLAIDFGLCCWEDLAD